MNLMPPSALPSTHHAAAPITPSPSAPHAPSPAASSAPSPAASSAPSPAELLQGGTTVAVVGFSTDPGKPSHRAPMELVQRGWNVIPVHPTAPSIAGLTAYKNLADIPVPIDIVNVFRPAAEAPAIAREAAALGAKTLWLQRGIVSDEARVIAEAAGMHVVQDTCAGATSAQLNLRPAAR